MSFSQQLSQKSLFILDRDGVINEDSDNYVRSPAEWQPIPGSLGAIAALNHLGKKVAVATNQSGISRGYFSEQTLAAMHQKMTRLLAEQGGHIDALYYCPDGPDEPSECRKPKPGMYKAILNELQIQPNDAVVIGDSLRDLQAAHALDIDAILVLTGKGQRLQQVPQGVEIFDNLATVVQSITNE